MEKQSRINLDGAYQQLKEEQPLPWRAECLECKQKMITELKFSYLPDKDTGINMFRPAYCPDCDDGAKSLVVKVIGTIGKDGELYPRNKKGRIR